MDYPNDEPDSGDLLMMQLDLPELEDKKKLIEGISYFSPPRQPSDENVLYGAFENCHLKSGDFAKGFASSGELENIFKCQKPFRIPNENIVELFGVTCSIFSPLDDLKTFYGLFVQRIVFLEKRYCRKPHNMFENDTQLSSDIAFNEVAFYLAILRYLAFKISANSNVTSDEIVKFVSLIHQIHMFIGKVSSLKFTPSSSHSILFHASLTARWTVATCLHYLSSLELHQSVRVLPRFCQFVGNNWGPSILMDNHIDSFSKSQMEILLRQVTTGILYDLILLSEISFKKFVQVSHTDSFSSIMKQQFFECSCIKEFWICTIKLAETRGPLSFWEKVACIFDTSSIHQVTSIPPEFEPNTLQIQWWLKKIDLKLAFLILFNIVELHKDMENYSEIKLLDSSIFLILERLMVRFSEEVLSKTVNEIEISSYFNVVRSVSLMTNGTSIKTLLTMWECIHPRLNESFRVSSQTIDGFISLPHTYTDWLEKIEKIVIQSEPQKMNSFEIFLAVLSTHLSEERSKSSKILVQFFGRVRFKLNYQTLSILEERGLFHVLSIFIILVRKRSDNQILNGLQDIISSLPSSISRSSILFKGLCSIFVTLVKEVSCSNTFSMDQFRKVFELLICQMESVLNEGTNLHQVSVTQNYALLLKDPLCLSKNIIISQSGLFHPCLIKHLEKKVQGDIVISFKNLVLSFMRYYQERQGTQIQQMTSQELELKKNVDVNAKSVWRLLLPLMKNFMCSSKRLAGPFLELAELAYGLTVWAYHCGPVFKSEWLVSDQPLDCKSLFKTFSLAHNIHPQVTCAYLRFFLSGELASSEPQASILESWTRCAISLQAQIQNTEVSKDLKMTTEEISKLDFFSKFSLCIEQYPTTQQDFFKNLVLAIGSFVQKNPSFYTTIESKTDVILRTFVQLLQRPAEEEKLKNRLIEVAAWIIYHWIGPLLYQENLRDGRVTKNFVGQILTLTFLRQEFHSESFALLPGIKKTFRSTLPSLFHGIGSLLNLTLNESVKRYLRELFTIFSHRFECNEMHPVAKVFQSSKTEMIRVQIAFYQYFYEVVFPETKRVKAKRPNLVNLINLVRTGFLGSPTSLSELSLENFFIYFLPPIMDVFMAFSHEDILLARSIEELITVVLRFSKNARRSNPESNFLKVLEGPGVRQLIRERMPNCISKNMFDLLSILSRADPRLIINLKEFLKETVDTVEKQRHQSPGTGHLSKLLSSLLEKIGDSN